MSTSKNIFKLFIPILLIMGTLTCLSFTYFTFNDPVENLDKNNEDIFHLTQPKQLSRKVRTTQKKVLPTEDRQGAMDYFMKNANLQEFQIPQTIVTSLNKNQINEKRINIMNVDTFYREALPSADVPASNQAVLLLHGAAFKSQTWVDLKTIAILCAMGHRVVAIDLPGFGETKTSFRGDRGKYLNELVSKLQLRNFILVSPSMSGGFSIPYLIQFSNDLDGYVPVAPVSTDTVVSEASKINTPTLILYGERDHGLGHSSRDDLSNLPNSQVVVLPNARHPAYLDQPEMFHTLLYNFLKLIKDHKSV